jgi:hypothetical protein
MFNKGGAKVQNEEWSGHPGHVTQDLKNRINQHIRTNRRFTLDEICEKFPQPLVSWFMKLLQNISTTKNSCKMVGTDAHWRAQEQACGCCFDFLVCYHQLGNNFLDQIVTGDETWVSHIIPESKHQFLEWHHSHSLSKPIKFIQTLSTQKVLATVFWDWKGIHLMEFMPKGETINTAWYCATLKRLQRTIQNLQQGQLSTAVVLPHSNVCPHTATSICMRCFFFHPPYSPDFHK